MNTLIIYDDTGFIISQMRGTSREPVGVPFMWVDIPEGKHVSKVDVSGEVPVAVLEDNPMSAEQRQIEDLKARQEASDAAIAELTILFTMPQI